MAAFKFNVPQCSPGATLQLTAPDGVVLQIPLPTQAEQGDEIHLAKAADGKWALSRIVKTGEGGAAAVAPVPKPTRRKKTREQVEQDLAGPDVVTVRMETTRGPILLKVVPSWSPLGAERFLQMVDDGYYREVAIYRGIPNFLVQFGIVKDPERSTKYSKLPDDPNIGVPYLDGMVGFAAAGPNTRTTTMCLFLGDIPYLGNSSVETPIGMVCPGESMTNLHSLHLPGDIPQCGGKGPDPEELAAQGNEYIATHFLDCDFIVGAGRVS